MSKKNTTPARRPRTNPAEDTGVVLDLAAESRRDDAQAFGLHLSAALQIARTSPALAPDVYNQLADAWNNIMNDITPRGFYDSPEMIALVCRKADEELKRKGGAK